MGAARRAINIRFGPGGSATALVLWPLAGACVGGASAAAWWIAVRVLLPGLAAGVALATAAVLTGAAGEDGFAKVCDGFGGARDRQRVLDIMQDNRIGAFGAVGLVLLVSLKWQAMAALPVARFAGALITAHVLSRAVAALVAAAVPEPDAGRAAWHLFSASQIATLAAISVATFALLPTAVWLCCVAAAVITGAVCAAWFRHRIGGATVPCAFAAQQLTDAAILLTALAAK